MWSSGNVSVHALSAGHLTLPEAFFVTPLDDQLARKTVPSLSFLIQHRDPITSKACRLIFDLGIRRKLSDYAEPIYKHALTRQPISGEHDTVSSLKKGGLTPGDIDFVIFSHLHWDHIGTPSDYPESTYIVGPGAVSLIDGSRPATVGSHNHFEKGILDLARTVELPSTGGLSTPPSYHDHDHDDPQPKTAAGPSKLFSKTWRRKGLFDAALDVFDDGSLYIISAPGHLDGHINLLCRLKPRKYVYLAGDACHDSRLLSGDKEVATWADPVHPGVVCCIHKDKAAAERTLDIIRETMSGTTELGDVEVVFAHDDMWEKAAKEQGRFFPGSL